MFEKELINYLYTGFYNRAKELVRDITFEELYEILLKVSFETGSLIPYGFLTFMLLDKETAQIHHAASVIISTALSHYDGAFSIGLLHARKAAILEPDIITHQEWLLSFYDIPDQIMNDQEAREIAQHILEQDCNNTNALKVLKTIAARE